MELRPATPDEIAARDALTHKSWGDRLDAAAFHAREETLRSTAFARGTMRTWLLVEGSEVLASCETFRMESRFAAERGATFGIATVFVEESLRGRGYARTLIGRLVDRLRDDETQACILYSEVGTALYEAVGFRARPAYTRAWPARAAEVPAARSSDFGPLLAAADRRAVIYRIRATTAQIGWHAARAEFYEKAFDRAPLPPFALQSGKAWAILCPDHRNDRLIFLDLEPGDEADTKAVLVGAADAAARAGLREVTVQENPWSSTGLPGGERRACDEGIPMILPLHPSLQPGDWRDYTRAVWV